MKLASGDYDPGRGPGEGIRERWRVGGSTLFRTSGCRQRKEMEIAFGRPQARPFCATTLAQTCSARTEEGESRGRAERAPAVAQAARGRLEHGGQELLGTVERHGEPERISTASIRVFFIPRCVGCSDL